MYYVPTEVTGFIGKDLEVGVEHKKFLRTKYLEITESEMLSTKYLKCVSMWQYNTEEHIIYYLQISATIHVLFLNA